MTLDYAQEAFRNNPTKDTAGKYLSAASEYESDGMIEDETFHDVIAEVTYWLLYNRLITAPRPENRKPRVI